MYRLEECELARDSEPLPVDVEVLMGAAVDGVEYNSNEVGRRISRTVTADEQPMKTKSICEKRV
jgi:hypothetical protein